MSVEKLTINELLDAYDYIMRVTTSGTPLYQRAESARYYLQQLLHYQKLDASFDHIRDLVEAEHGGLLVVLPCKVGDTVWVIWGKDVIYYIVDRIHILANNQVQIRAKHHVIDNVCLYPDLFGKTVFLTRAEAEQKLHDIKSELDAAASEHEQED